VNKTPLPVDWICVRDDNFGVMTTSINKIKDIVRLNKPIFNEKYKVWVVRMKTKNGWKAVWRKDKDDSGKVYDLLIKRVLKEKLDDDKTPPENLPDSMKDEKEVKNKKTPPLSNAIVNKLFNKNTKVES
jgi:hypothetical protein